ncbi:MAG: hypothetical protein INQ03_14640 [Candidatus Heimdallarchaeota archaeon]|nr:hypothetical protein [Candidatus Heimdallarchaeota archaeon]
MFQQLLPLFLLLLVNLAVIFRRIGGIRVPAWTAFMAAAILIAIQSRESYDHAIQVIAGQADVFVFLFGMFVIVTALETSGSLEQYALYVIQKVNTPRKMLFIIVFIFGLASSVLINDTVAIIGPLILIKVAKNEYLSKDYVLALAIALTFGSALLPTGNPQNFLLSIHGDLSFIEFFGYALIPTILGLLITYIYLHHRLTRSFSGEQIEGENQNLHSEQVRSKYQLQSEIAFLTVIIGLIISSFLNISSSIPILVVSSLFLFFSSHRDEIISKLDWGVLIFFAGMFVVIDAVSNSEYFRSYLLSILPNSSPLDIILFLFLIFLACQVISNVPVAVILTQIIPGSVLDFPFMWVMLAMTTTFAGATTVLGAASNIIVIETSSKRGVEISWIEFTKLGFPLSFMVFLSLCLVTYLYMLLFPII